MIYHILNGDSLAYSFPAAKIDGETIVVREALIDGDLSAGKDLPEFWHNRAAFIGITESEYDNNVAREFEKILTAPAGSVFYLWFEYDLFCQVNMWFVLSLINRLTVSKNVFAVYTSYAGKNHQHFWNGFGPATTSELEYCFANCIPLHDNDISFGNALWIAYQANDQNELLQLSKKQSPTFPFIAAVIQAHLDRSPANGDSGRPEKVIEDITKNISTSFPAVCKEFWKKESIYGFGDTQLKQLYDKVMHRHSKPG